MGNLNTEWFSRQSASSFERILPRLRVRFPNVPEPEWQVFASRMERYFGDLFQILHDLYSGYYDFFFHLENIMAAATQMWIDRPDELKALDATREADPHWFTSSRIIGYAMYADLFAGGLHGIRERIPYLKELGVTYVHIMPPFRSPDGDNDGGYAITSYRDIHPALGTMNELVELARDLRAHGISLCLDFVFNHTADEHEWARKALAGDPDFQEYYRMYESREMPDQFEKTLQSIFPDEHPGCFTYQSRIRKWVWTTFKTNQWDLNYENPVVFNRMAEEMLFLANQGVEVLRLDAVAFLWKRLGTNCENLPEAHKIIQAFNLLIRITAPALVFKSEAIVHPDEVAKYISTDECQISYHPTLMALLWNSLATRKVDLLRHTMQKRFAIDPDCAWVNYVRCHDDIGWTFSNEDAEEVGMHPDHHRHFLNQFYTGNHEASFATGLPFQSNPETGDMRISGTCASLSGLERALDSKDGLEMELALRRILLIHGVLFTIGGIPLIYSGDELGAVNNYDFRESAEKARDTRWVHRAPFDWEAAEGRNDPSTWRGRLFHGLLRLSQLRQTNLAFTRSETEIVDVENTHVFAYFRHHPEQTTLMLANFTEDEQAISGAKLRQLGLRGTLTDLLAGQMLTATQTLDMQPYQFMVLVGRHR